MEEPDEPTATLTRQSIGEASAACLRTLRESLSIPALMSDEWSRKRLADFNLWASGSGAFAEGRASLDERLLAAQKQSVRSVILDLLGLLQGVLRTCHRLALLSPDGESPSAPSSTPERGATSPSLSEALCDVEALISQLVRISAAIRSATKQTRLDRADATFDGTRHEELRVHSVFLASISALKNQTGLLPTSVEQHHLNHIAERLVEANLRRRHRFLYARRRWMKQKATTPEQLETEPQPTDARPQSVPGPSIARSQTHPSNAAPEPVPASESPSDAVTSMPTAIEGPVHIPPQTTSERSFSSPSITNSRMAYPKPPPRAKTDAFFMCPCCYQTLPRSYAAGLRSAARWRKHLVEDILPYTCVLEDCPRPMHLYRSRQEWAQHMHQDHQASKYWLCTACLTPPKFHEEAHFKEHLLTEHRDVVSADQIPFLSSMSQYSTPPSIRHCPLCPIDPAEDTTEVDVEPPLLGHVAEHIHSFALLALPWQEPEERERHYLGWNKGDKWSDEDYFDVGEHTGRSSGVSESSEQERIHDDMEDLPAPVFQDEGPNERLYIQLPFADTITVDADTLDTETKNPTNHHSEGDAAQTADRVGHPVAPRTAPKLLVAVDFGTTFSGVAYANTREPKIQSIISDWGDGSTAEKVPSVLKYEQDDIHRSFEWGYHALRRAKPGSRLHERFKLGLNPEIQSSHAAMSELMTAHPSVTALPPIRPKQCEKLVVDYLKSLKDAVDTHLRKKASREVLALERTYMITVPALWSEAAQEATKGCAAEAFLGDRHRIDEIQIIAESEAAGVYALTKMPQIGLTVGDTFVICDAGGGTVDLTSYGISKLSEGHIELEGQSIPSGGLCGSSFLNRIFADYLLNNKLKNYIDPDNNIHMRWLETAVNDFERVIKPEFTGNPGRPYYITAFCFQRDSQLHGIQDNMVELTARELREGVFDIVVSEICELVTGQISRTRSRVKAVLLAGGFGQNPYLRSQIGLAVGSEVQVLQIAESRTAVVRGALISALSRAEQLTKDQPVRSVAVVSRLSPKHYGVRVVMDYDSQKELHRRWRSRRVPGPGDTSDLIEFMQWFVMKGEQILEGQPKSFGMYYEQEAHRTRPPCIECPVYTSDADTPPESPDDPSLARPLLTLEIDLSDIPDLPTKKIGNRTFYHVDFDIYMTMRSADLEFVLGRGNHKYAPQHVKFSRI